MPNIVRESSSSTEKVKLKTLYSPNKGSPKVIKSHEDSGNSKSKSSSKMSYSSSKRSNKVIKSHEDSKNSNSKLYDSSSQESYLDRGVECYVPAHCMARYLVHAIVV
jgi:hypothetical protein